MANSTKMKRQLVFVFFSFFSPDRIPHVIFPLCGRCNDNQCLIWLLFQFLSLFNLLRTASDSDIFIVFPLL